MPDQKASHYSFDAFLSHNSRNKAVVRDLKKKLAAQGLNVWLDEDELRPGLSVQKSLETGIKASKSIVVVVGADGIGPWENKEIRGALQLGANDDLPIIPVLLPGCPVKPELPFFLSDYKYVDLRDGLTDTGVGKLVWGITGKKPGGSSNSGSQMAKILKGENVKFSSDASAPDDASEAPATIRASNSTPPMPPPLALNQVLPGRWQIQIQMACLPGVAGQFNVEIFPNGAFNGQLMGPMGALSVSGQWQANPMTKQIGLQGMQTNGYQTMPYIVMVQVNYFDRQRISGMTSAGENVNWRRGA